MNRRTRKGLKLAAAVIFAALLVAITVNGAVDFWMPQAELKDPSEPTKEAAAPALESDSLQKPLAMQPLPAAPLSERTADVAEPQWNQLLFEPKFDGPGVARRGSSQGFTAPDFTSVLNQYAPLSQVLPPSVSATGSDPLLVSVRPIFGGKSGGVESGTLGAAGGLTGTAGSGVGGAVSGAGSLLNKR
jgi:hypothetical protein